jgi:hypothetical protein
MLAYARGVQASAALHPKLRALSSALLRKPLTWAALVALLGALPPHGLAKGLRGTERADHPCLGAL